MEILRGMSLINYVLFSRELKEERMILSMETNDKRGRCGGKSMAECQYNVGKIS